MGVLDDLTRPAGDGDVVGGVAAKLVASPASTGEVSALLSAARDLAVVVRGAGTKIDWAVPPRELDLIVDTGRLTGVVEHAAGDLITVVRAGTPLTEIDLGTQVLALDGPAAATVGGTVATATSGPRRLGLGTVRDLLIGITVVLPGGRVAKSGGKVVKNVAGYDLGKLYTGSYGTLGLITECVFRLHPRPATSSYVIAPYSPGAVAAVLKARVAATAVEYDALSGSLAVLLEGTSDRSAALASLLSGDISDISPPWWGDYYAAPLTVKLSVPLSGVDELIAAGFTMRGSAGAGVFYAAADGITDVERMRAACVRLGGHAIVLTAPADVRQILDMWGPAPGLALMRRVKDQFDPGHRFAPGRFVGGI